VTPRVLIVDDEPRNIELLEAVVATCGVETAAASNGRDAVILFRESRFDLVLLDVMMPGMDGFATLAELRAATPPGERVPIVLVTALQERADRLRGLEAGADDFLTKPIDPQEVRCRVRLFLQLREMHAALTRRAEELEREKEARAELAAMIVHDLKNPLAAISGNVRWVLSQIGTPETTTEELTEALNDVDQGTNRLVQLISTLIDVEKAESQGLVFEPVDAELRPILERLAREHAKEAADRNVTISVVVEGDVRATIDPDLVTRALENLLLNAVRYAGPRGRISLEAKVEGEVLVLRVANTGIPIAENHREQLFQKYATTERRARGDNLGLGLYFCRLVCEQHRGTIAASSADGWATVMTMRLPLHAG
jgi:two-component system, sensor histidine kinase and response regulator